MSRADATELLDTYFVTQDDWLSLVSLSCARMLAARRPPSRRRATISASILVGNDALEVFWGVFFPLSNKGSDRHRSRSPQMGGLLSDGRVRLTYY